MFRTVPLSIIRIGMKRLRPDPARKLYDIHHCCVYSEKTPDDGQRNCPKHAEFYSKNKFEKLVHLVYFIIRIWIQMHQKYLYVWHSDVMHRWLWNERGQEVTSGFVKYRVILSLEAPNYCLMRNTGKCKSLDESSISRGVNAVFHRCRNVYINLQVIISTTYFL